MNIEVSTVLYAPGSPAVRRRGTSPQVKRKLVLSPSGIIHCQRNTSPHVRMMLQVTHGVLRVGFTSRMGIIGA